MTDNQYIKRTIQLAKQGLGSVYPNPMVGTVIVKNGIIVGEGYHQQYGKEHAEIMALNNAGVEAWDATLYVNLEPCCHYGKTPPCTDAIIKAGIKKVIVGMLDPFSLVDTKGVEALRNSGIEVVTGVEEKACRELNRVFIKYVEKKLPYVTLKIAQTLDGRIATKTGDSKWITSAETRAEAHRLRCENDAVIVGINTVINDNPRLTVRHIAGENPYRIVLDTSLKMPLNCKLLSDEFTERTIIATLNEDLDKTHKIESTGAKVWTMKENSSGNILLLSLLQKIVFENMSAVLVEGGAQIFTSFIKEKLADRVIFMIAPKIIGSGIESIQNLGHVKISDGIQLTNLKFNKLETDIIISGDIS